MHSSYRHRQATTTGFGRGTPDEGPAELGRLHRRLQARSQRSPSSSGPERDRVRAAHSRAARSWTTQSRAVQPGTAGCATVRSGTGGRVADGAGDAAGLRAFDQLRAIAMSPRDSRERITALAGALPT